MIEALCIVPLPCAQLLVFTMKKYFSGILLSKPSVRSVRS